MNNQGTKNALLAASLLLNLVLIVSVVWLAFYTRNAMFSMVADMTEKDLQFQQMILKDLETGDPARVAAAKEAVKSYIGVNEALSQKIRTSDLPKEPK